MLFLKVFLPLKEFWWLLSMKRLHSLPEYMYENSKIIRKTQITLTAFLHFCFRIVGLRMLIFETFLPVKESLMATFNKIFTLA